MPCAPPVPMPLLPGGPLNPIDWIDVQTPKAIGGAQQSALMRGTPGALAPYQRRQIPPTPDSGFAGPIYLQSRSFSRGAGQFGARFGHLNINPIGGGVYAPWRIPTIAGPGARYEFAAIWFDVQSVPTTMTMAPTMTQEGVAAILAQSYVAAMYPTTA